MHVRLHKNFPRKNGGRRKGFALIATLTLMMLLAILAVGVLAMASSQSRISMQAVLQAQARQQALVGLDAAIAELQVELGPDRRVSANSSILNNDDGSPGGHLLGVWNSWDGPIYGSSMSGGAKIQSTYAPGRPNMFRRWLISTRKPEDARAVGSATRLCNRKPGERICLLGEGTLGTSVSPAHYVYADMIALPPLSAGDPNTGCFAWWVSGENQKAKVAIKEPEETKDPIEVLHRTWNTPPAKFGQDSGLDFLPDQADRPERVLTMPSLPLLANTTQPAGMPYFHDATVTARSVPTNVRMGGLKQDLCLLFNKQSLTGTEFACRSSQDCPIAEGNDVPKGTEPNMPIGSYQTMYAYYNAYPDGKQSDNAFAARMQGTLGQDLYTRMSGSGTDDSGGSIPSPDTPGKKSFYDTRSMMDAGNETAGYARTPVMLAFLSNYAYVTKQITEWDDFAKNSLNAHCIGTCAVWFPNEFPEGRSAWKLEDGGYYAYLAYTPLVLWWNPYNVEMRIPAHKLWSFSTPFRQIWMRKLNGCIGHVQWVDLFVNRWAAYGLIGQDNDSVYGRDGGDYYEAEGGGMGEIVFKPGEILFFTPTTARVNEEKKKLHSNPWSVGVHQNALSGYTYRIVGNVIPTMAVRDRAGTRRGLYPVQLAIGVDERFQPGLTDNEENPADPHGWKLAPNDPAAFTVVSGFGGMSDNDSLSISDAAVLDDKGGMSPQRMLLGWINKDRGVTEPGNGDEHYNGQHLNSIPISDEDSWAEFMNDPQAPYYVASLGVVAKSANAGVDTRVYPNKDYRTKIWQHSSPAFWGSAIMDPDDQTRRYHPYQLAVLPTGNGLSATPLDNVGNNGLLGITGESGEQVSFASVMEIPVHPPFSLAGFAGMRLQPGWYQTTGGDKNGISQLRRMQYQAGVPGVGIGNAFADPCLPPGDVYAYFEQRELGTSVTGNTHIFGDFFDHGLLINDALWDRWFCSSVSDMPGGKGKIKAEDTLQKFMKGTEQLPVARHKKVYTPYRDEQVIQHIMDNDGWKFIAQYLMVEGGFNVNSTSVPAWTAVLQGLAKRRLVAQKDGRLVLVEDGKGDDEVVFSRFMASTTDKSLDSLGGYSVMQGSAQLRSLGNAMAAAWGEVRLLQPDSIARLAEEIVKQVRKRGPFLSMSDFINRRLDSGGGEEALKGALQAAIDATDINTDFFNDVILDAPAGGKLFKFPQADAGSMHTAAPGYLIQSDVLASLGNILTVRDDTFTVRAYGCVRGKDGAVLAQAWCQATVQRTAEYLSPVNKPADAEYNPDGTKGDANLTEVNRLLGRKMRVVAFKWMDPWDI